MSEHLPKNNEAEIAALKAEIQKLALKRIRVLEKEILEKQNMTVRTGIELEFFGHQTNPRMPNRIDPYVHAPAVSKPKKRQENFSKSPFIVATESDGEAEEETFEIVLDSTKRSKNHRSGFYDATVMARAAIATQKLVEKQVPELYRDHIAKFIAHNPMHETAVFATHVNASLWDKTKNTPEFKKEEQLHQSQCATLMAQKELLPLTLESTESLERFGKSRCAPTHFAWDEYPFYSQLNIQQKAQKLSLLCRGSGTAIPPPSSLRRDEFASFEELEDTPDRVIIHHEHTRLENRLAGADADPALAMLISVAGLHYGLNHQQEMQEKVAKRWRAEPILPTASDPLKVILSRFEASDIAKEMLGEELHQKIVECRKMQYAAQGKGQNR